MGNRIRRLAPISLALALAGCSRDLDVPSTRALVVTPPAATVAPRQALSLAASGGAGGYRFAFAAGGRQSGEDASVDPGTGAYRAGAVGPAQDVVEVSDAAGVRVQARIAVGPRVAVTPVASTVAPGGTVALQADGGLPSGTGPGGEPLGYAFGLADPSTGSTVVQTSATTALYRAARGAAGKVERVVVSDATRDAAATATAEVRVGDVLQVYPANLVVAPNESVQVLAFGGQSPYQFTLETAGSGAGASVNLLTGLYHAGANEAGGTAIDSVLVTDDNGEEARVAVAVTPPLRLDPITSEIRPGKATQLVARGGKPPYAFAFAPKGNRSHGTVDAITGAYVPGWNVGAVDLVQVTDAAGTVARLADPRKVGPVRVRVGTGTFRCLTAALDAPPSDLVLVRSDPTAGSRLLTTVRFAPDGRPAVDDYYVDGITPPVAVVDADSNAHSELVFLSNGVTTSLVADPGGRLLYGPRLSLGAPGSVGGPGVVTGQLWTNVPCTPGAGGSGMKTIGWDPAAVTSACKAVPAAVPATLPGAAAIAGSAPRVGAKNWLETLWLQPGTTRTPAAAAVAWAAFEDRNVPGTWSPSGVSSVAFPDLMTFAPAGALENAFQPTQDGSGHVVLLDDGSSGSLRRKVALVRAAGLDADPVLTVSTPVDPLGPGATAPTVAGIAPWAGTGRFVAWDGATGQLSGFGLDAAGALASTEAPVLAAPASFPIGCAVLGDLNGDGTADLVLAGKGSADADVLWGDSDGSFGTIARFASPGPAAIADADGDSADDVVAGTDAPSLATLWGAETAASIAGRQLAWGPETSEDGVADLLAVGDFTGDGALSALYQDRAGTFRLAAGLGGGLFDAAVELAPPAGQAPYTTLLSSLRNTLFVTYPQVPFAAADLGGGAPGDDAWALEQSGGNGNVVHAFLRTGAGAIVHVASPPLPTSWQCAAAPIPRSSPSSDPRFAALCVRMAPAFPIQAYRIALTQPAPGTFAFEGTWTPVGAAPTSTFRLGSSAVAVTGFPGASATFVASLGEGDHRLVGVSEGGATTTSEPLPISSTWGVTSAHSGNLDGDATPDLVLGSRGALWVLERPAGSWTVTASGASAGNPFGLLRGEPGRPGAILVLAGRELLLLRQDGGALR